MEKAEERTRGHKIEHDGLVNIATAGTRRSKTWKNAEWLWSDVVGQCSEPIRTKEKYLDYMAMPKGVQGDIKDVGGFVGGFLQNGRRKANSVAHRQLVTLDADFVGGTDLWGLWEFSYGAAALCYSTHAHSSANPRLRLVIPLDRPVYKDEYQAISRAIAASIDIDMFDDTTFEPSRMMYWPSASTDAEFVFRLCDTPWLCADEVLSSYADWHDARSWPTSTRASSVVKRDIKKAGDPLTKPEPIGAFNRAYCIPDAIAEFLPDVYEPFGQGRYTYTEGSTVGGLVVYEDGLFAHSFHGSDPVCGQACNAFDLVRIHRFGLMDEDTKDDTPVNRLPSYKAMCDFAVGLPGVKKEIAATKLKAAQAAFEGDWDDEWQTELDLDSKGRWLPTINNFFLAIENDPGLKGLAAHNTFNNQIVIRRKLPWDSRDRTGENWSDSDFDCLLGYLERTYGLYNRGKTEVALSEVIMKRQIDPVKDYLESLTHDGESRVDTFLVDWIGAADTAYTRAATRKFFTGCVARIMEPGCKFDYMLVLVGEQGIGKSTLISKLAGKWFSDTLGDIRTKEAYQQLLGVWILEVAELSSFTRAEREAVKHFTTKRSDDYRLPYGHYPIKQPRRVVFYGTTNTSDFLQDETGNRRFWPVDVTGGPWQLLGQDIIDQLWAEAVAIYRAGEPLYLTTALEAEAKAQQLVHKETDAREGLILDFLELELPESWENWDLYQRRQWLGSDPRFREKGTKKRDRICACELHCELFRGDIKDLKKEAKALNGIMRGVEKWERKGTKQRTKYGTQVVYERKQKR